MNETELLHVKWCGSSVFFSGLDWHIGNILLVSTVRLIWDCHF